MFELSISVSLELVFTILQILQSQFWFVHKQHQVNSLSLLFHSC